jgi:predicted helicase
MQANMAKLIEIGWDIDVSHYLSTGNTKSIIKWCLSMSKVFHASLHGLSSVKERELSTLDLNTTQWSRLDIESSDFYLFISQNTELSPEYNRGWKVTDIFPVSSVGIVTGQDAETIAMQGLDAERLAVKHRLSVSTIKPILYRPFDQRYITYDSNVVTRPRGEVMRYMLLGDNLGLISSRQQSQSGEWGLCGVTNTIIESCSISNKTKEINSLFPLYLYPTTQAEKDMGMIRTPNLSREFLTKIEQSLGYQPTPEAIFHYIYAIFHSPTYRSRYAEFLKIDFPRVPLTSNDTLFRQLGELGEELVGLHLMKSKKIQRIECDTATFIEQGGSRTVNPGHPKYDEATQSVVINKQGDRFTEIPLEVWNFHVGGYQVLAKWLKDRKGRVLSKEDIQHYRGIVVALSETIRVMGEIDGAIPSFPIQ